MVVLYSFELAGSERLGSIIASKINKDGFNTFVCATHGSKGPVSDILEAEGIPCFALDTGSRFKLNAMLALYNFIKERKISYE